MWCAPNIICIWHSNNYLFLAFLNESLSVAHTRHNNGYFLISYQHICVVFKERNIERSFWQSCWYLWIKINRTKEQYRLHAFVSGKCDNKYSRLVARRWLNCRIYPPDSNLFRSHNIQFISWREVLGSHLGFTM